MSVVDGSMTSTVAVDSGATNSPLIYSWWVFTGSPASARDRVGEARA
jgi:hypothetical protein